MRRLLVAIGISALVLCFTIGYAFSASSKPSKKAPSTGVVSSKSLQADTGAPGQANVVRGGTLRTIKSVFPRVIGYVPDFGPSEAPFALPVTQKLVNWDEKGNLVPELVESWDGDPKAGTLTWHLRKGVKFSDGTPFDAEALKWDYDNRVETKTLFDLDNLKSLEIIDQYTLRMHINEFTNMTVSNYGFSTFPMSPTAFKKNGGKDWARMHAVGTGPFTQGAFVRDTSIRYERNKNYWRKGYPLIDALEVRYVPDPVTTQMMMEAKEADVALEINNMKIATELEQKGFKVNWGPGNVFALLPNSTKAGSIYANKKVREALEYAIDRPALAKVIGFGKYEALTQLEPAVSPAHIKGFNPRPYDPEKAKKLLAEAGYPNGFDTKLLIREMDRDAGVAIQSYLTAVGIRLQLDIADLGRYAVSVYSPQGWDDLALSWGGVNPDATDLFVHWGSRPQTHRHGKILKSKEFLATAEKALHTFDPAGMKETLRDMVRLASEDAMIVPLYRDAQACVMQPWVHSDYMKIHRQVWQPQEDWMDKHK